MSDLISRSIYKSKLLKALDVLNKEYREAMLNEDNDLVLAIQNQQSAYTIALRLLDNEPIAYDVNKVVEELEKLADENYKAYCIAFNSDDRAEYDAYTNAIEIVKHGDVSDDVCEWKDKELYGYYTSCTEFRSCIACKDKYWKYCPYCGKKIKVVE